VIPSLVLTLESPTYLSKFSNLNRVSHPQKDSRPNAKNQITVVVERPFTPATTGLVWVGHSCPTPLTFLFHTPVLSLGLPRHFRNCFQAVTSRCNRPGARKIPSRRWHARWAAL